ncbi:protein of unknown function [Taphrina deformans PYCC 5710]|uniref:MYND-type domain-containing protein n=1 Tax=Taphrina deformans (strain PYCC 5710 / ATCC 11124 / CBS 356.35 / IMI 108563 / JCM 9778 / NBRC 8474) TaxID=1097556 RepID=R4XHD1_TAPDE|nr:protein of unknown function [Taphrina deformans PYCC 5710]|eukprot:CCG83938.1 protein of unknown function [Taphrina deformans PYCC 5710]
MWRSVDGHTSDKPTLSKGASRTSATGQASMEVQTRKGLGRCAVASDDLERGYRFLEEEATLYWETTGKELLGILNAYASASTAERSRVDDLTSEIQTSSNGLESLIESWIEQLEIARQEGEVVHGDIRQDAIPILLKAHFNAHAVQRPDGACLFPRGAMLNHSCAPNSFYRCEAHTIQFFSNATIEKGKELTAAYLDAMTMLKPTKCRQQVLLLSKGFLCECSRCLDTAPDKTRLVPCLGSSCEGTVHAGNHRLSPTGIPVITKWECTSCGVALDEKAQADIETLEDSLYKHWEALDARLTQGTALAMKEVNEAIRNASKRLHPNHFITNLYRVLAIEVAAVRNEDRLQLISHAFKYANWLYETFRGVPSNLLGTMTGAMAELFDRQTSTIRAGLDVDRVLSIIKTVLPYAQIRYGEKAAYPKALGAVLQRYAICSSLICNNDGKLKRCGRCNSVAYCSRSCQVFHFKSQGHRTDCAKICEAREALAAIEH